MAYAAVISLKHNIQQLIHLRITTSKRTILDTDSLTYMLRRAELTLELNSLVNVLRGLDATRNRSIDRSAINALEMQVSDAVWKLEDVIESYVLDCTRLAVSYEKPPVDIKGVELEIDSFLNTVKELREEYTRELNREVHPTEEEEEKEGVASSTDEFGGKKPSTTVRSSPDQIEKIIHELVVLGTDNVTVISVLGMAGIGKTHLVAEIYQHPIILQHFDALVWVNIGQKKRLKDLWVDVVAQVECRPKDLYLETNIITLVHLLGKSLSSGRRFLIVLDNVWSACIIQSLTGLIRGNIHGSRLLLTSRLEEVGKDLESSIHHMRFLNMEESWELLWRNVFFAEQSFPPQLEKAGRKIAEQCEGLPLLILTVADILCGLDKTIEYWSKVADSKTTTFTDAYDKIWKVLYLSFEYLPQYLKACFLYMAVFPQTCKIPLSKLINLLIVEDFLEPEPSQTRAWGTLEKEHAKPKPTPTRITQKRFKVKETIKSTCRLNKSFETIGLLEPGPSLTRIIGPSVEFQSFKFEVERSLTKHIRPLRTFSFKKSTEYFATECLEKLVSNSLVIVCKHSSKSRIKSCKLHSAYWHLCVKEARENKFFHVLRKLSHGSKEYTESQRRLCVQNIVLFGIKEARDAMGAASLARSLLCTGADHEYPVPVCLDSMLLLKVLDALAIRFYEFPVQVLELLQLRYLALTHNGEVPRAISNLQQLQSLIVRQHHNVKLPKYISSYPGKGRQWISTCLPMEIWDMQQLRHIRLTGRNLPHPTRGGYLPNLLTLEVDSRSCNQSVFYGTRDLKKLGIRIELLPEDSETITCFKHINILFGLESLKCVVVNTKLSSLVVAPPDHLSSLPRSLQKLSLNGLGYSWEYASAIGSLPNLRVLKLRCSAFQGAEWVTAGREFARLEFLLLEDINLVKWTTIVDGDDNCCFPSLQRLIIRHCYKLKRIPLVIGTNPTLKTMEVFDCNPSLVAYAKQLCYYRNSLLQLHITSSWNL